MAESVLPAEGEYLTTGWETDLAADDSLVRQVVLAHASWPVALARGIERPWRAEPGWSGAWIGDRGAFTNFVMLTQPPGDLDELVSEVGALIPAAVPYVMISPWPADFGAQGLALLGHLPVMVRIASPGGPPAGRAVDIREVTDADGLATAERVLVAGYPMPEMEPLTAGDLLGTRLLEGPTRVWLGYVEDEPVAVAVAHAAAGVTLVEFVATLPAARGRGVGAGVTWAATLADPDRPAALLASDDGRPVYERMGYRAIERWTAWLRAGTG